MREVGDGVALHLEVDLHGRAAQLGMGGGGGIRVRQPSEARNIPGQLDDPLVIDVVQHVMESNTYLPDRPWRARSRVLYRGGTGGKTVRRCVGGDADLPSQRYCQLAFFVKTVLFRRLVACPPRLPVTLRPQGRRTE